MGKRNDGYLIPENITPDDDFCAKVYIPNDETYKQNFLGAYLYFASWVAWQRNDEKTGKTAARRWRDATEKTLAEWGNGCGIDDGDEMTEDQITDLIQRIMAEMAITINNNNCGCGCGCGSGCGSSGGGDPVDYTIPLPDDPPVSPPPANTPPVSPDNAQKCSMANYLVYSLRLTLLKVMENGGDFVTFTAWWTGLFESVSGFVYALAYQTWQWAKQALTGQSVDVNDIFDEFYNLYVCNLFSATDTVSAYEAMQATLFETLKGYPDLSYVARIIAAELPYDLLFKETGSIEIPAGFTGRSCCGEIQLPGVPLPFDLPIDATYRVIPVKTAQLNLTVKSAHVTMVVDDTILSGASTIKVSKPTLHYGDGTPSFLFSGVAAANSLAVGWVKMGLIVEYVFATHYGYPVGTFGLTMKNQSEPSTGFYSVAILQPEIEAIDGGAFISQFDVLKYPSETLLDGQSAKVDFLNHANVAYNGYATMRLYALYKVV